MNIPNFLSLLAILLGMISIILIIEKDYKLAFNTILLGVLCDMFDGYIARKLNTVSVFGKILDSFADLLLYVLSIVFLFYSIFSISVIGTILIVLFVMAAIYRLAYFFDGGFIKRGGALYYRGMPVYFHLILFQLCIWSDNMLIISTTVLIFSLLMISSILVRKAGLALGLSYIVILCIINNIPQLGYL